MGNLTKSKEEIKNIVSNTESALLVYLDENGDYRIAALCDSSNNRTVSGYIMEMASVVSVRLDNAAECLLD